MSRYEVGNNCVDNDNYVLIWDNKEQRNCTWTHKNLVHKTVRDMNTKERSAENNG